MKNTLKQGGEPSNSSKDKKVNATQQPILCARARGKENGKRRVKADGNVEFPSCACKSNFFKKIRG